MVKSAQTIWLAALVGVMLVIPILCCNVLMIRAINSGGSQGSTADWVVATATVGALVAASVAAVFARAALQREAARDRWRDLQDKGSQASLVAAWAEQTDEDRDIPEDPSKAHLTIAVRNASEIPVFRARIEGHSRHHLHEPIKFELAVVPPSATRYYILALSTQPDDIGAVVDALAIDLIFRDSGGRLWNRNSEGKLVLQH